MKKNPKLPKEVEILGRKIRVVWADLEGEDLHGKFQHDTIKIASDPTNNVMSTLFHECIHASLDVAGHTANLSEGLEEAIVVCIENALYPLIEQGVFNAKK